MQPKTSRPIRTDASFDFCVSPVAAACMLLLMASGVAHAQNAPSEPKAEVELKPVVVTGIRRAIESSVAEKRNSDSIIEAVSSEDLGKLPDSSIAESLARLPGVTGQRGPDGRVNVISIRGLSPAFAGALLNGREVVSSGDGRAVEYDQFPSELVGSAIVYKTPDASLLGQGLSGTVDIRTLRPLDSRGRQIAVNVRGERNSNENLVPGVASPTGKRFSYSFVDQFADNTVGLAVGFAHLDSTTQVKQTELVEYGDYTPYGLPLAGNAPSLYTKPDNWGYASQSMLPMFWTATSSTKKNVRDGLMAVLEYKPNADLRSELDLYFSKFDTHEVGGKFLSSMFANWGSVYGAGAGVPTLSDLTTVQSGRNTLTTGATVTNMPVTTGNFDTRRSDKISSVGWNTSLKFAEKWTATSDLSFSRDVRDEAYNEVYAAPYNKSTGGWNFGDYRWNVPVSGGSQTWTPLQSSFLSNPAGMAFGDVSGFDFVPGQPRWTGALRTPHVEDEIKTIRLSAKRSLDGVFSSFVGGVNYTQRDKSVDKNETRLLMPLDANGKPIRDIPNASLRSPFDMSWAGIPSLIRIDVPSLVPSGALTTQSILYMKPDNSSSVHEKITTLFAMLNIDTEVAGVPIRGNAGIQNVHTKQNSEGWEYRGNNDIPDASQLFKRDGGASYSDTLPSLNLVADLHNNWITRFGLAETTARPAINDMRAGTSTPTVILDPGPHQGEWNQAYAGNPGLKPWRAVAGDLSLEKYFGKRSYVSIAAFRKNLLSYITYGVSARDNSFLPLPANLPPGFVAQQYGPVFQPLNGSGGRVQGAELSASIEGGLFTPVLDGYGIVASYSKLSSSIRDQAIDPNSGKVIQGSRTSLNGLSGMTNSVTAYYEKYGYSARVSQRYRSAFTATTRDIYLNSTTRQQAADKVVDLQLGYAFDDAGAYKGLSLMLQVNNLLDKSSVNYKTPGGEAPDSSALYPNYTYKFGRQTLFGMNYKF